MTEICKSGFWLDRETGQVVDKQPVSGRQLVAPGTPFTPDAKATLERFRSLAPVGETAVVEPAEETEQVAPEAETASVPPARETAQVGPERKRRV